MGQDAEQYRIDAAENLAGDVFPLRQTLYLWNYNRYFYTGFAAFCSTRLAAAGDSYNWKRETMSMKSHFKGRSLAVINDLSIAERKYLFNPRRVS